MIASPSAALSLTRSGAVMGPPPSCHLASTPSGQGTGQPATIRSHPSPHSLGPRRTDGGGAPWTPSPEATSDGRVTVPPGTGRRRDHRPTVGYGRARPASRPRHPPGDRGRFPGGAAAPRSLLNSDGSRGDSSGV